MSEKTMEQWKKELGFPLGPVSEELARRIDEHAERIAALEGKVPYNPAPPAGVYVKPGMRVKTRRDTNWRECGNYRTVAPKGSNVCAPSGHLSVWLDDGSEMHSLFGFYTYNGQPVLGYEEDKP